MSKLGLWTGQSSRSFGFSNLLEKCFLKVLKYQDVIVGQWRKCLVNEGCVCVYPGTHVRGVFSDPGRLLKAKLVIVEKSVYALRPAEEFTKTICFTQG